LLKSRHLGKMNFKIWIPLYQWTLYPGRGRLLQTFRFLVVLGILLILFSNMCWIRKLQLGTLPKNGLLTKFSKFPPLPEIRRFKGLQSGACCNGRSLHLLGRCQKELPSMYSFAGLTKAERVFLLFFQQISAALLSYNIHFAQNYCSYSSSRSMKL